MADEPLFMLLRNEDPAFLQTIRDAQATLNKLRGHLATTSEGEVFPCVKTLIRDGAERAFIWLLAVRCDGSDFVGRFFEIPKEFPSYRVGDEYRVPEADVTDWMVNDRGVLHGGYSLRYQRSKLPPEKRPEFDRHVGVERYA